MEKLPMPVNRRHASDKNWSILRGDAGILKNRYIRAHRHGICCLRHRLAICGSNVVIVSEKSPRQLRGELGLSLETSLYTMYSCLYITKYRKLTISLLITQSFSP
jgi:hypothetical protein